MLIIRLYRLWTFLSSLAAGILYYWLYGATWYFAVMLGVAVWITWVTFTLLVLLFYRLAAPHLPIRCQYPLYWLWKRKMEECVGAEQMHVLVRLPLKLYLQFQLDDEFRRGGFLHAYEALRQWLVAHPDRIKQMYKDLAQRHEHHHSRL